MNIRLKDDSGSVKARILALATVVTVSGVAAFVPFAAVADHTTAHTIEQLSVQIAALQAQLVALSGAPATPAAGGAAKCAFTRALSRGVRGDDVKCLQMYLNSAGYIVAASGPGSPGNETTYYGGLTVAAVAKWQAAMGVSPAVGYFGAISRAKYDATVAAAPAAPAAPGAPAVPGAPVVAVPVGSGLTVTAAVDQPPAALAPADAARVPFTKVIFTASADGDVTVNALTIERQGVGSDSGLASVVLLDEDGFQLGLSKTLNSVHQANLNEAFVVKAGTSRTMTLAGNRAGSGTSVAGEIVKLGLVAVDAGTSKVNAAYPIVGNGMTMNTTLTIGSITNQPGAYKTVATTTEDIGKKEFVFTSIRVTAGSQEKVYVEGIRWNQVGSIGGSDIENVMTTAQVVGGDKKDYAAVRSSDGKYYTSKFGSPGILLDKGQSIEIYVKGDIAGGSDRTIKFNLFRTSDLAVKGETYGFGITPPTSGTGFSSTNPWYFASQVTVGKGSLNIENSTTVAAQNVAINLSEQPFGAFLAEARGEAISVAQMVFNLGIDDNGAANMNAADVTNITIYDSTGILVAGPKDGVAAGTVTFSVTITFPIGRYVYILMA